MPGPFVRDAPIFGRSICSYSVGGNGFVASWTETPVGDVWYGLDCMDLWVAWTCGMELCVALNPVDLWVAWTCQSPVALWTEIPVRFAGNPFVRLRTACKRVARGGEWVVWVLFGFMMFLFRVRVFQGG